MLSLALGQVRLLVILLLGLHGFSPSIGHITEQGFLSLSGLLPLGQLLRFLCLGFVLILQFLFSVFIFSLNLVLEEL